MKTNKGKGFQIKLVAPCGMDCAVCKAFMREKDGCPGCGLRGRKSRYIRKCVIKYCVKRAGKGRRFCFSCSTFPCARLKNLDKRYRLKYRMSMLENLGMIRDKGLKLFLEYEEKKWKCPHCGEKISCHMPMCMKCGAPVI